MTENRTPGREDRDSDSTGRILRFPSRKPPPARAFSNLARDHSPVEDIDKYEKRADDPDDYAHRMKMNALAVVLLAGLLGGGIWIVDVMAQMRKNQDCALSGRRNCAPIEASVNNR